MMYKNDFVVCIRTREGKILREEKSSVFLPFNSEYSIYMKNLREVSALVTVTIDGEDVLNGSRLIIRPNSILDLERFMMDNSDRGPRFKFIQKTEKISEFRGDRIDDGIVRVEFWFEKKKTCQEFETMFSDRNIDIKYSDRIIRNPHEQSHFPDKVDELKENYDDRGITVKGSESKQRFVDAYIGELESENHVITLMLKGKMSSGFSIKIPSIVGSKKICQVCGTQNENGNKFCRECGNSLVSY